MDFPAARITTETVSHATDLSKDLADRAVREALRYVADAEHVHREAEGLCASCYYLRRARIGGAAMTTQPCGLCGTSITYGSTATDKLCRECAIRNELCKQCGGDLKLRVRRKFLPAPEPKEDADG